MLSQDPNQAKLYELYDTERLIDQAVLIKYVAPKSFSGEDMVEIICTDQPTFKSRFYNYYFRQEHGWRSREVLHESFLNGKMDLPRQKQCQI